MSTSEHSTEINGVKFNRIEFIGIASTHPGSEAESEETGGSLVQPDYLKALATAHEESGFDRILVAHSSASPDGFTVADQVLTHTERLGVLLAHRPGFVSPTYAARKYATLDAFHPGRVALHTITGGDDREQARDGDLTDKATRYRRSDEFLSIVRSEWTSPTPFDFEGEFYTVKGGWSSARPAEGAIPIYFGGASEDAIRVGGKHADVYAFWGEPLLDYVALGVSTLLIRGFYPLDDARDYGNLIRLVREQHDGSPVGAAARAT